MGPSLHSAHMWQPYDICQTDSDKIGGNNLQSGCAENVFSALDDITNQLTTFVTSYIVCI